MQYVLGFLFDPAGQKVALIEKQSPPWQKGRLNGIGGKVEQFEHPNAAMIREFEEETGVKITNWKYMGAMSSSKEWIANIYTTTSPLIDELKTVTDEQVVIMNCTETVNLHSSQAISNVPWLISICRDHLFNPNGVKMVSLTY